MRSRLWPLRFLYSVMLVALVGRPALAEDSRQEIYDKLALIEDSFSLELNEYGFQLISQILQEEVLGDLQEKALPDVAFSFAPVVNAKLSGMKVSLDLDKFAIVPTAAGLKFDFTIRNLVLDLKNIRLENYFLPSIATECHDTRLVFGNNNPLPVAAHIGVGLSGRNLQLAAESLDFELDRHQYVTQGPAKCYGLFKTYDRFSRFIMKNALAHARVVMAKVLKKKVEEMVPKLAAMLNRQLAVAMPLEVPDFYLFPGVRLLFKVVPKKLVLTPEHMQVILGLDVDSEDLPSEEKSLADEPVPGFMPFATLGLNPKVVNEVFAHLLRKGSREMEIAPELHEKVAEFLQVSELSHFWPDLEKINPQADHLRLFISLKKAPTFTLVPDSHSLKFAIPDLAMRFQVKLADAWTDYFILHLGASFAISPDVDDGTVKVSLHSPSVSANGQWATGYEPKDPSFDAASAGEVFATVMQYAFDSYSPFVFELPPLQAGGAQIKIDNFRVDEPFMKVDMTGKSKV